MRKAGYFDMPRLLEMGRMFHKRNAPPWDWSDADFASTMSSLMENGFVCISDKGFIAAVLIENPLSRKWKIAKEFLWWSDGDGISLLREFERWAEANGADEIQYSCPANQEKIKRFFGRIASPSEAVFSKEV